MRKAMLFISCVLLGLSFLLIVTEWPIHAKETKPELKIIKDQLMEMNNFYFVTGTVHNPYPRAVKNVIVKYYIWKKWMGKDGHGLRIKETGGLVTAKIKYILPKTSVDFTATGGDNAPVMAVESGKLPDPINAEIAAQWD